MKVLKYLPLLALCSCTSTRVTDNSKHYSYNSSNHQVKTDVQQSYPQPLQPAQDEVLYRQNDQDFVNSSPSVVRPYIQQNYASQPYNRPKPVMAYAGFEGFAENFFERTNPKRNFRPAPPNVIYRQNEYNPNAY